MMNSNPTKNKIVVVGGGTAGAIAASYIKSYWSDQVEVILIYDHKAPNIGIGESLTPKIYEYLNYVGITREDLIRNVNATVKLGIKFKNWLNDGSEFYHPFTTKVLFDEDKYNFISAYDMIHNQYDFDIGYGKDMFANNRIPIEDDLSFQSVHIDGVLFSKFIIEKFQSRLTIIDDVVTDVVVNDGKIDHLTLEKSGKILADFYIDASGFSTCLFKHMSPEWIDKSDWLPLDSCIPNPIPTPNIKELPVCTLAEASEDGWILQVPLSNRIGAGYLFSSRFTLDEVALERFDTFLRKKYDSPLTDTFALGPGRGKKILKFKSGYWKNQWIGNCLVIGLSSGFAEPLEATNIHQAVFQVRQFIDMYNFNSIEFDSIQYNKMMAQFYERVYLFIRFCYTTGREDSDFWKYMTNNTPYEVKSLEEKIKTDFLNLNSFQSSIFNHYNFTKIAYGLKKINTDSYKKILNQRYVNLDRIKETSDAFKKYKTEMFNNSVNHFDYIKAVKL